MNYNRHLNLAGAHSFLSPSNYHWTNYTPEKLEKVYLNQKKKEEGVILHELASTAIINKVKLAPLKKALHAFVNDAIGFGMESELVLYYSDNCFGTVDAISFKDNVLRIHDLKTGFHKASFRQLDVYAALFCLEYGHSAHDIAIEQRIYQGNGYSVQIPDPEVIEEIKTTIVNFDLLIDTIKSDM